MSIKIFQSYIDTYDIPLFAYCLMPDHLHLLIGPTKSKGIVDIVRDLKSQIGFHAKKKGYGRPLWQKSFYDHFLRKEESVQSTVSYILNNPVRKGMVNEWRDYPYSGSPLLD